MPTRQVIEIDVTWNGYNKLRLNRIIEFFASRDNGDSSNSLQINRITVKEVKKK